MTACGIADGCHLGSPPQHFKTFRQFQTTNTISVKVLNFVFKIDLHANIDFIQCGYYTMQFLLAEWRLHYTSWKGEPMITLAEALKLFPWCSNIVFLDDLPEYNVWFIFSFSSVLEGEMRYFNCYIYRNPNIFASLLQSLLRHSPLQWRKWTNYPSRLKKCSLLKKRSLTNQQNISINKVKWHYYIANLCNCAATSCLMMITISTAVRHF